MRKYLRRSLKKVSDIWLRLERFLENRELELQNRNATAKPENTDDDWWAIK